jgi:hypothetical protein
MPQPSSTSCRAPFKIYTTIFLLSLIDQIYTFYSVLQAWSSLFYLLPQEPYFQMIHMRSKLPLSSPALACHCCQTPPQYNSVVSAGVQGTLNALATYNDHCSDDFVVRLLVVGDCQSFFGDFQGTNGYPGFEKFLLKLLLYTISALSSSGK